MILICLGTRGTLPARLPVDLTLEVSTGFCASSNNHTICPRTFSTLACKFSSLYTTVTGSDSLNDGFPSLSCGHSIKYHLDASVTIPNTLFTSCSLLISLALHLRDKVDSICTDAWANPFIKSSFLTSIIPRILLVERHSIA